MSQLSTRCRCTVAAKQTAMLLIPLENDMGGRRSCATICFPLIVPPVQVEAELRVMDPSVARAEPGSGSGRRWSHVKSNVWLNRLENVGFLRNPKASSIFMLMWENDKWHFWRFILFLVIWAVRATRRLQPLKRRSEERRRNSHKMGGKRRGWNKTKQRNHTPDLKSA